MTNDARAALAAEMAKRMGPSAVLTDKAAIGRFLRDSSWLSPILSEHFNLRGPGGGHGGEASSVSADMVVTPTTHEQLRDIISLAVRHRCPLTIRGGGTTNFAQSIPLEGGIVVDFRKFDRILGMTDGEITCEGGALQGDVDAHARRHGLELPVMVTTYNTATAAGWVAGGHVGLGGPTHGTIWDGNVSGAKLLTVEDPPREMSLRGEAVTPLLRTSGATGIMTEVSFPLVKARRWLEAVVAFADFERACGFVDALTEAAYPLRAAAAQEPPLPRAFGPAAKLYGPDAAIVLMIVDAAREADCTSLSERHGGVFHRWQVTHEGERVPIAWMSYGHRMLWVKRLLPSAGFLNSYVSPTDYRAQFAALKREFGDGVVLEHKYIRSAWLRKLRGLPGPGTVPAPLLTVVPGDRAAMEKVMRFCDSIAIGYQNPHTFSAAETGLFPDMGPITAFARQVDPYGLLNPGKLHGSFFKPERLERTSA